MITLDKILENTGKGLASGLIKIMDPIGELISNLDRNTSGVGYSDENALLTAHNLTYKSIYSPNEKVDFFSGYMPRFIGEVAGIYTGAYTLAAAACVVNPLLVLAVPLGFGALGMVGGGIKYLREMIYGEKGQKKSKATFKEGFKFGYENSTSFLNFFHELEANLTGRGFRSSHIKGPINSSSKEIRRNFSSMLGNILGKITGTTISYLSLGIVPIYKGIRDTIKYNLEPI